MRTKWSTFLDTSIIYPTMLTECEVFLDTSVGRQYVVTTTRRNARKSHKRRYYVIILWSESVRTLSICDGTLKRNSNPINYFLRKFNWMGLWFEWVYGWKLLNKTNFSLIEFFLQTHNIGNNADISIRDFTSWKQKIPITKCYPSEYWTPGPLIPIPTFSFLG